VIGSYVAILRRNVVWILCLALTTGAAVFGYLSMQPLEYRSDAIIEVRFTSTSEQVLGQQRAYEEPQRRVTTEADLAMSRPVAELAAERLAAAGRKSSAAEVQSVVEATPRRSSNLVELAATDSTPGGAQAIARAVSESYLEYRRELETAELRALEQNLRTAREEARRELAAAPDEERDPAAAKVANINSLLDTLRLRLSLNPSKELLRSEASLPSSPTNGLSTPMALAIAALAGSLLALALVLLSEWLHDSVRTRSEAELLAEAPVLGVLRVTTKSRRGRDVSDCPPLTSEGERSLRLGLARHFGGSLPSTLLLAGLPSDADACLSTARSLAVSCAGSGQSVLLVADGPADQGAQYLSGAVSGRPDGLVRRPSALPGVHEAAATSTAGVGGVFDFASPGQALRDLAEAFDLVLVAASGQHGLEATDVGALVDATVPVCTLQRTPAKRFRQFVARLIDNGAVVPGVVVTDTDRAWRRTATDTRSGTSTPAQVDLSMAPDRGTPRARVR
jgi:capsular polysaccharide biosynthesis protein